MNATVQEIIAQMPTWSNAPDLTVEPIGGLTNANYLIPTTAQFDTKPNCVYSVRQR